MIECRWLHKGTETEIVCGPVLQAMHFAQTLCPLLTAILAQPPPTHPVINRCGSWRSATPSLRCWRQSCSTCETGPFRRCRKKAFSGAASASLKRGCADSPTSYKCVAAAFPAVPARCDARRAVWAVFQQGVLEVSELREAPETRDFFALKESVDAAKEASVQRARDVKAGRIAPDASEPIAAGPAAAAPTPSAQAATQPPPPPPDAEDPLSYLLGQ